VLAILWHGDYRIAHVESVWPAVPLESERATTNGDREESSTSRKDAGCPLRLYLGFAMSQTMPSLLQPALGSMETARRIAQRAGHQVSGYSRFLAQHRVSPDAEFGRLPLTDKASYIKQFPWQELVGEDLTQTFHIFSSSGSSGRAFYWPQLRSSHCASEARLRQFLESTLAIHQRPTLVVVGLALGSWIGGDLFSWLLKSVSINTPYPFAVFSPGNKHDDIIAI